MSNYICSKIENHDKIGKLFFTAQKWFQSSICSFTVATVITVKLIIPTLNIHWKDCYSFFISNFALRLLNSFSIDYYNIIINKSLQSRHGRGPDKVNDFGEF